MLAASVISVATSVMTCLSTQSNFQTGYHLCMPTLGLRTDFLLTLLGDLRPEIATDPTQTAQVSVS
jgi:hypothetical protein